ncbi:hypothetical protein NS220_11455 [Microbacterium testaceum]|uniref:Uncharacterized protein n=1 Tax=Microbacterium testaceum TaxID=2033 RepID=A0A147EVS6_MICTE|nr:hypothetical protein [Microbacterium testaceum]KTR93702.1 hypothetical protein NS220_11455 [Microbacterium testaceum]
MRRQERGTRVVRGAVAAAVATFVALLSHVTAGGAMPGAVGIVVPLALSFVACTALAGRRLSAFRLSLAVGLSQLLFHALFVLGSYQPGAAAGHVHAGAAAMPALGADSVTMTMVPDASMWLGHLVAAALTTAALHRGERTVAHLRELAVRLGAWLRARVRILTDAPGPTPARRVLAEIVADVRAVSVLLAATARRRGPPLGAH